jgi:PST family polysaccharide transporter
MASDLLSKELKSAIIKSMLGKYSVYFIQIFSLVYLARLFTPVEFGIIAIAVLFLTFFQVISISGLAPAIVFLDNISHKERDGIFTFGIVCGLFLSFLFFISLEYILMYFDVVAYYNVFLVFSISVFFTISSFVPLGILNKYSRFELVAKSEIIAELISLAFCCFIYYSGGGIWALVTKVSLVPVIRFVMYMYFSIHTYVGRPCPVFHFSGVVLILNFVKYQIQFNVLNYFSRNLDNILIAKFFGVYSLGLYEKVYQLMRYPLQLFTFAINPALQPVLTKHKSQPAIVFGQYAKVMSRLSVLGLFCSTVLVLAPRDIVNILFGSQWFDAAPLLSILSVSISVQMVLSSTGGIFQAFGETKSLLYCGIFSFFTTSSAIVMGVYLGSLNYICYFLVFSFFVNFIQCFYILKVAIFIKVERYFSIVAYRFLIVLLPAPFLFVEDVHLVVFNNFYDSVLNVLCVSIFAAFFSAIVYFFEIYLSKKTRGVI